MKKKKGRQKGERHEKEERSISGVGGGGRLQEEIGGGTARN